MFCAMLTHAQALHHRWGRKGATCTCQILKCRPKHAMEVHVVIVKIR